MTICYFKLVLIPTFFKAFNRVLGSDFSFLVFLYLVSLLFLGFICSFFFFLFFRWLFVFISVLSRNLFNSVFKFFLSVILDFILLVYRVRFFLLLGSSYYDPLSKIFLDNLSSLKGEFLMDFYNFSNKFLFENDFNVPLFLFPKLPLFDSSKNSFLTLSLSRLYLTILEHQNRLRSYFYFVSKKNSPSFSMTLENKVVKGSGIQFNFILSFSEFCLTRLNSVFIDFFSFVSLVQEYLYSIRSLSFFTLLCLKYFSFLKNIFLAILVHLEVDSFAHYIHVNLYRLALQRYYNKDDWNNLMNTYDFSLAQSNAFSGDRGDDFFFFLKISFFYFVLGVNMILFYVLFGFLAFLQGLVYLWYFVCTNYYYYDRNSQRNNKLLIDNLLFSFNVFSFLFLFFFKFFNIFYSWFIKFIRYIQSFFRSIGSSFLSWSPVFDFFSYIYIFLFYCLYAFRVCFISLYSLFFNVLSDYSRFSKFSKLFKGANMLSHYSFIVMCFRKFRDYSSYVKLRNAFFAAKIHSAIMNESSLVQNKENIDGAFFLKECFFFFLSRLCLSRFCLNNVSRFYFFRFLIFRFFVWLLFWASGSKYTQEQFLSFLSTKFPFDSFKYFNIFIFLNLLVDRFFFILNYSFEYLSRLFSFLFYFNWRGFVLMFMISLKNFFVFVGSFGKIVAQLFYNIFFFSNLLIVFLFLVFSIFFVFVFFYFVFVLKFIYFIFFFFFFFVLFYFFKLLDAFTIMVQQNTWFAFFFLFLKISLNKLVFYYQTIRFCRVRNLGFFNVLSILFTIRNDLKKYEMIHRNVPFSVFNNFYSDLLINAFLLRSKSRFSESPNNIKISLTEQVPLLDLINFQNLMKLPYQNIRHLKKGKISGLKTMEIKNDFFVEFEYHKYLRSRNFRNLKTFRFRKALEPLDFYRDPNLDALSTFDLSRSSFLNFDPLKFFYFDDSMFYKNLLYFREVFSRRNLSFFYNDLDKLSSFRVKYSKISPLFRYFYLKRERLKYALTMYSFGNINNFSFTVLMNWILNYRILRATLSFLKLSKRFRDFSSLNYPSFHIFRFLFFMDKFFFFYNYVCFGLIFFIVGFFVWFYIYDYRSFVLSIFFILFFFSIRFLKVLFKIDMYLIRFYTEPYILSVKLFFFNFLRRVVGFIFQVCSFMRLGLLIRLLIFFVYSSLYLFFYFDVSTIMLSWLFSSEIFFLVNVEDSYLLVILSHSEKLFSTFFVFNFCSVLIFFIQYFVLYFLFKIFVFKYFRNLYFSLDISLLHLFVCVLLFLSRFFNFFPVKLFKFSPSLLLKEFDLIIEVLVKENNYIKTGFLNKFRV